MSQIMIPSGAPALLSIIFALSHSLSYYHRSSCGTPLATTILCLPKVCVGKLAGARKHEVVLLHGSRLGRVHHDGHAPRRRRCRRHNTEQRPGHRVQRRGRVAVRRQHWPGRRDVLRAGVHDHGARRPEAARQQPAVHRGQSVGLCRYAVEKPRHMLPRVLLIVSGP
jgi:hypothetical protein